ncbi:hypothetical protein J7L97_03750, partial [Candidatus Bathyarchaeota archaeon]|nr:hypothetical protein [Candidatus Bathyarchaeota archaeon]
ALIDEDGEVLWHIDLYGHCGSSVFYRDGRGRLILAFGYEDWGFYFLDALTGEILKEWHLGHGQGVNLASYRPDQPDNLAIAANTFRGGLSSSSSASMGIFSTQILEMFTAGFPLIDLETELNSSGLLMVFMMVMEGWWLSF